MHPHLGEKCQKEKKDYRKKNEAEEKERLRGGKRLTLPLFHLERTETYVFTKIKSNTSHFLNRFN